MDLMFHKKLLIKLEKLYWRKENRNFKLQSRQEQQKQVKDGDGSTCNRF